MEQRQEAGAKVAQMKKASRKIDGSLLGQHEYDDYNINESQDSQSNGEVDLDKMKDLNFGSN